MAAHNAINAPRSPQTNANTHLATPWLHGFVAGSTVGA
jgi:hypothetical protein